MSASDAILDRIAALAPDASPGDLVELADAYQKVSYGPAGGTFSYDYRYTSTQTTIQRLDRDRSRAGFSGGDEG